MHNKTSHFIVFETFFFFFETPSAFFCYFCSTFSPWSFPSLLPNPQYSSDECGSESWVNETWFGAQDSFLAVIGLVVQGMNTGQGWKVSESRKTKPERKV